MGGRKNGGEVGPALTGARGPPLLGLTRHSSPGPRAGAVGTYNISREALQHRFIGVHFPLDGGKKEWGWNGIKEQLSSIGTCTYVLKRAQDPPCVTRHSRSDPLTGAIG